MAVPIEELAKEWLRLDKDPDTQDEIYQLLNANNKGELELRLRNRMTFGTAGLRAKMQAGFGFINSLTIIQTSQGLAEYLLANVPDVKKRGVVIGRDARHNAEKFMRLAITAFVAKGIRVYCYTLPVHTPLVPFGVNYLNAAAGVMLTASHNPAQDNGYKVWWSNGCQIIPPHDTGIAAAIEQNLEPLSWDDSIIENTFLVEGELGQTRDAYYQAVAAAATIHHQPDFRHSKVRFVYTPLHGVGLPFLEHVISEMEIPAKVLSTGMSVVAEQAATDPNFPTVKFPNPEEKGALDLAIHTADHAGVTLILANDPDADRFAAAEKVEGKWHQFTGNQIGVLLAAHVYETYPSDENHPRSNLTLISSTVSSQMISFCAKAEGVHHVETLTGFKWIGNKALELEAEGYDVRYGYEEALGYMSPAVVHDKDGIVAAAIFLTAVERWRKQGMTPFQKLQSMYQTYGYFADGNTYLISPSAEVTKEVFASIRKLGVPHKYPSYLGHFKIHRWRDLTEGFDTAGHNHVPDLPVSKDSEMITVELEHNTRFTMRGSGTEPKIKIYVDAKGDTMESAQKRANEVRNEIVKTWFDPEKWGFKLPFQPE
ncbi:hypothetical protein NA57DRAFT_54051 [Rhizodiscina lignyota]|uniref:Phosphoglucomutase n=1 Tax=Rhizodiscina lignyota TaxID=1504668 RepID=A0A9P4IMI0_9PEZI|nr:hypothetical protein NA57DRAFT_54051 [Rhizodiscina lignyota]